MHDVALVEAAHGDGVIGQYTPPRLFAARGMGASFYSDVHHAFLSMLTAGHCRRSAQDVESWCGCAGFI